MRFIIAAWLLLLLSAAAFGQGAPDVCVQNDRHQVVGRNFDDKPGTKFLVIHKRAEQELPCRFDLERADWIVSPDNDPFAFVGLQGDHLILSYERQAYKGIVAYNVAKQSLELDQDAVEWDLHPGGIWFWQPWPLPHPDSCPGFVEPIYELHRYFDFAAEDINDIDTAESRCRAR